MELNTEFKTFVTIKDTSGEEQEIEVLVNTFGYYIKDGFNHAFGYEQSGYVEDVSIDNITLMDDESNVDFTTLSKDERSKLIERDHYRMIHTSLLILHERALLI